jgi:hypothetical protein
MVGFIPKLRDEIKTCQLFPELSVKIQPAGFHGPGRVRKHNLTSPICIVAVSVGQERIVFSGGSFLLLVLDGLQVLEVNPPQQGLIMGFIIFDQVVILHENTIIVRSVVNDHAG